MGRSRLPVGGEGHTEPPHAFELCPIPGHDATARRVSLTKAWQLHEAHRSAKLVETVVEPLREDVVGVRVPPVTIPRQRRHAV